MFQDYPFLVWFRRELDKRSTTGKKNSMHTHLDWLLERGETRTPLRTCPVCRSDKVRYFFVRRSSEGISVNASYISCDKPSCIDEITAMGMGIIPEKLELKFSSLTKFKRRDEKRALAEMYKSIFLPLGKISRQKAFDLFIG